MSERTTSSLVGVRDLRLELPVEKNLVPILHGVDFQIGAGEAVGLVGESGSGKSMTARSIARLLPGGAVVDGQVEFDGQDVLELRGEPLRRWRGSDVQIIFQDPRAHINPVRKIGDFLREAMVVNRGMSVEAADHEALGLLDRLRVSNGPLRLTQYPHELSGGLLQRVMIASAIAVSPRLLIADEPTTALDVTTQAEVVAILDELRREQGMSLLFITHDLELAAAICDRTLVMYAGMLLEDQPSAVLHEKPLQPYTAALLASRPSIKRRSAKLSTIPGRPVSAAEAPDGCPFAPRCPMHRPQCDLGRPPLRPFAQGKVACVRAEEIHADDRQLVHEYE